MAPQEERIYFVGGTGGVGSKAVRDILDAGIKVTIYTRQPEISSFKDQPNVTLVQGDYSDFTPLEKSIAGHTRLFVLTSNQQAMAQTKGDIAKIAYAAGVRQIVDVSSITVDIRLSTYLGQSHKSGEEAIRAAKKFSPNSSELGYVSLRPWRFYSNHIMIFKEAINVKNIIPGTATADTIQGWVSPNDIGALAAIILQEPIAKHGDAIYPMVSQLLSGKQRAEIFTKLLGRSITYQRSSIKEQYEILNTTFHGALHKAAYDLAQDLEPDFHYSPGLSLVLGREPETLEEWVLKNKSQFTV